MCDKRVGNAVTLLSPHVTCRILRHICPDQVDIMVLYSSDSLNRTIGGVAPEQMESMIADEITVSNEATTNSEVDLQFNLVFVGPVSNTI